MRNCTVPVHISENGEQGSTSVLATLAALAETMGPLTAQAGNSMLIDFIIP